MSMKFLGTRIRLLSLRRAACRTIQNSFLMLQFAETVAVAPEFRCLGHLLFSDTALAVAVVAAAAVAAVAVAVVAVAAVAVVAAAAAHCQQTYRLWHHYVAVAREFRY